MKQSPLKWKKWLVQSAWKDDSIRRRFYVDPTGKYWWHCSEAIQFQAWWYETQLFEPRHDKTNKVSVRPAKTQISLGICPVWSESLLSAWRNLGPLATHWAHSEDSDQTGWIPRLIWVFAGRTLILLVLSCRGSFLFHINQRCYLLK